MKTSSFVFGTILAAGVAAVPASALVLFDGTAGGLPDSQGSLAYAGVDSANLLTFGTRYDVAGASSTTLTTTGANSIYAGYSNRAYTVNLANPSFVSPGAFVNPAFPTLDAVTGYVVTLTFRLISQTNDGTNGANRSGFSLTVLGDDAKGIEIGFRGTDVFSQDDAPSLFVVGESNAEAGVAGLVSALNTWQLTVLGTSYTLSTGGNTILSGMVRDYSAATGLASDGYRAQNLIALGDNTTSARGSVELAFLSVEAVPEPSTWAALAGAVVLAVAGVARLRRR